MGRTAIGEADHVGIGVGRQLSILAQVPSRSLDYKNLGWTAKKTVWGILVTVSYNPLSGFVLFLKMGCRTIEKPQILESCRIGLKSKL